MNEPYQDDRDDPDVQVVFDGNENEHLDLLRVPVSQATATGETETRGARAKEWIRGTLAVAALFGLCGVGALSLNRTPSLELHAREPGASWLAGEPAAAAAAASCKKAHAPNGAHAPERPAATPVLATFAPLAQGAHSATKQAAKKTKTAPTTPASPGVLPDGRIILNTATAEELTRLKGVGSKRASAIVALRTRLGGFKRISSLLRIRGIGVRTLKRLRPLLVLNPPEPVAEPSEKPEPDSTPKPNADGPSTNPPGPTERDPKSREPIDPTEANVRQLRASNR